MKIKMHNIKPDMPVVDAIRHNLEYSPSAYNKANAEIIKPAKFKKANVLTDNSHLDIMNQDNSTEQLFKKSC